MATWEGTDTVTQVYKTTQDHDIKVDVRLVKDLKPGKHPVIVYWHSGALVFGHRALQPLLSPWLPAFAAKHSALIVAPDYRLLPESTGADVLSDLEDLWQWLHQHLQSIVNSHFASTGQQQHTADLSRILLVGPSAGGWCAAQQSIKHASAIRAVILLYSLLDVDDTLHSKGIGNVPIMGQLPPSRESLEQAVRDARAAGKPVTEGGFDRTHFVMGAAAWGSFREWLGPEASLNPTQAIKETKSFPKKLWLAHGTADPACDVESNRKFIGILKDQCPQTIIRTDYLEGKGHQFDAGVGIDEPWVKNGLDWIEDAWVKE